MNQSKKALLPGAMSLCFLLLSLVSCAGDGFGNGAPKFSDPDYIRTPPPVEMPEYAGGQEEARQDGAREGYIDLGNTDKGYVSVKVKAPVQAKFRVEKGSYQYTYDVKNDGTPNYLPLADGDGSYEFTLFLRLDEQQNQYEEFLKASANVSLKDETVPFVIPNNLVDYSPDSEVVKLSWELAEHASSDLEVVQQVYYWVQHNIVYDTAKVNEVLQAGTYQPNVDRVLAEKQGICYDYAALVAAMLRANGIPCKLIMGDVTTEENGTVYHAWNAIWLKDEGYITVKMPSTPAEWKRLDLTFAASGDSSIVEFIGNGNNYVDIYVH